MTEDQIPTPVRTFIADRIDSVVQLEVLLLLHADPRREYTSADIGRELRINPDWAADQLQVLYARGLLGLCGPPGPGPAGGGSAAGACYHYAPASAELDAAVSGLVAAYADYRVTVTTLIFAKPAKSAEQIRSFADAFRIRRPDRSG